MIRMGNDSSNSSITKKKALKSTATKLRNSPRFMKQRGNNVPFQSSVPMNVRGTVPIVTPAIQTMNNQNKIILKTQILTNTPHE